MERGNSLSMKSFCIKTNNNDILDYLLNRIQEIDFEGLIYSKNKFKIYQNIIIHYQGKNEESFYRFFKWAYYRSSFGILWRKTTKTNAKL